MHKALVSAVALILALMVATSAPVSAQWFKYPTPGVPRTATGAVNLAAPAPRTADGKPDFSGIWLASNHLPCPPLLRDGDDCLEKTPLSAWAYRIDAGLQGGLPFQPWAAAIAKRRSDDHSKDDPHAQCLPSNPPRAYTLPHYQKVIQLPGFIAMLSEFNASFRQIFTDGRPLPRDAQPTWMGYSVGRWEGDTFVVDTIGQNGKTWLDMRGLPATEALRVTERFTRPTVGRILIDVTIDDPKAYSKPWNVRLSWDLQPDIELIESICEENNRDLPHMVGK